MMRGMSRISGSRRLLPPWLQAIVVGAILVGTLLPLVSMVLVSVMPNVESAAGRLLPSRLELSNYVNMWQSVDLQSTMVNSLIAGLGAAGLSTVVSLGLAYCLARFKFRGRGTILEAMVGFQSIPHVLLMLPLFMFFFTIDDSLGTSLVGSRAALILTYMTFSLPLCGWVLVTYLRTIPSDLEEAGLLDGLRPSGVLFRIVIPIAYPGIVVAGLFAFIIAWNDVLFANVLTSNTTRTVAINLSGFAQIQETGALPQYGQLMAASVVAALPPVLLYLIFQKYLTAGLAAGSVKG